MQKTGFSGKKQKKHHQRRKPRVNSASSVPKPKTTRDDSRSALSCCAQARGKRIPRRTFGKSRIQPFAGTARFAKAYLDFCASIFIVQYIFFSPFLSIGKERSKQIYFEKREKTGRKLGFSRQACSRRRVRCECRSGFSRQACSRRRVRCECREEERKHRQIFFLYLLCSLEAF